MPFGFEIKNLSPAHLTVPHNLKYDYMIYRLSKIFCINPEKTKSLTERDFWLYTGFENLDNRRKEYYAEHNQNKGS